MLAAPYNFFAEAAGFHNVGLILDYAKDMPFGSTDVSLAYAKDHRDDAAAASRACSKRAASGSTNSTNRDAAIDVLLKVMRSDQRDDVAKSYDYMRRIGYFEPKGVVSRKSIARS